MLPYVLAYLATALLTFGVTLGRIRDLNEHDVKISALAAVIWPIWLPILLGIIITDLLSGRGVRAG